MNKKLEALRAVIREMIEESPSGGLRTSQKMKGSSSGRQFRIGQAAPDENGEITFVDAEGRWPGATDAWAEIVPELFPEFPFQDPRSIIRGSVWFSINGELRVAFKDMPQLELAQWDAATQDWFLMDDAEASMD